LTKTKYLLDTNIFIEASRKYYHFDICPDFWSMLIEQHGTGRIFSIEPVKTEILPKSQKRNTTDSQNSDPHGYDPLSLWVKDEAPKSLFANCDAPLVIKSYQEIIQSVYANPQYFGIAKNEFASVADSWVIAYACANTMTVVTHENDSPNSKKRILMPAICKEYNIPVATLFEMLLDLKIQFIRK